MPDKTPEERLLEKGWHPVEIESTEGRLTCLGILLIEFKHEVLIGVEKLFKWLRIIH